MTFSLLVRRAHMYLALFLAPWMLMYALSTMGMNHREFFRELYGGELATWEEEQRITYDAGFPESATPQMIAEGLLAHVGLKGAYEVIKRDDGYLIFRSDPITPRRLTYIPATKTLHVDRKVFRSQPFLEEMHRRRGYLEGFPLENAWAASVDSVIIAMVFWAFSGLWMWWTMRATRKWGLLCAVAGVALFTFFLVTI